ncbi:MULTISPECIES: hypothetical protein [unclassified Saccharopolyspora]|uniref:hypothetical protein n=1 Tax=unclassified Saccharopolyspora TaxID=2646250 RepID=UPI001CD2897A|nr:MULTISPECIES: hypothetical protein [unclassified Saccharopolyspora]MCA1185090.1 hypothetical protein [Saccharopolyspora sp. 6T]MCA1278544.1 hypothetical protein [Saccharopolyspora sp. 7B]
MGALARAGIAVLVVLLVSGGAVLATTGGGPVRCGEQIMGPDQVCRLVSSAGSTLNSYDDQREVQRASQDRRLLLAGLTGALLLTCGGLIAVLVPSRREHDRVSRGAR